MSSSQGGVLGKGNLRGEVSPLELPDTSHRFNSNEISVSSQQEGFLPSEVPFCLPRVRSEMSRINRVSVLMISLRLKRLRLHRCHLR